MSPMWVQRSAQDAQGGPLFPLAVSLSLPVSLSFSLCLSLFSLLSLCSPREALKLGLGHSQLSWIPP